jgi:phospholipase D1/2
MKPFAVALALIAVLGGLAAAWTWSPLAAWVNIATLTRFAETLAHAPLAPLAVVGAYVVAGLLVIPVMLLIVVTGVVFGPLLGSVYALGGALASALVTYAIGRVLGRGTVRRIAGSPVHRLSRKLAHRGLLAIAAVRLVPIAPFSIVNMAAGACRIGVRDFVLGTALGMAPGIVATLLLVDGIGAALREPSMACAALLVSVVATCIAVLLRLRQLMRKRGGQDGSLAA